MPDVLKLPSVRLQQLRALSNARGLSIADLIAEFIRDQIHKGHIPADLPGITVERTGKDQVTVDISGTPMKLTVLSAKVLSAALRAQALPKLGGVGGAVMDTANALSGWDVPSVKRRGPYVTVGDGENGVALAPSVAFDLSEIIRKAAA